MADGHRERCSDTNENHIALMGRKRGERNELCKKKTEKHRRCVYHHCAAVLPHLLHSWGVGSGGGEGKCLQPCQPAGK